MRDLEQLVPSPARTLFPINEVRGMTGESIRQILNRLANQSTVYLECGLYCGLSFTSAMYHNPHIQRAIAIDSWAEFTEQGRIKPRMEFLEAVKKYFPKEVPLTLIEQDHWSVNGLPEKPDLFYYDGDHSEVSQQRALSHFGPMCAEYFTYCVDDWNWERVRKGTLKGLDRFTIHDAWEKRTTMDGSHTEDREWWNGWACFRLQQK